MPSFIFIATLVWYCLTELLERIYKESDDKLNNWTHASSYYRKIIKILSGDANP